jgi:hypothetical protein
MDRLDKIILLSSKLSKKGNLCEECVKQLQIADKIIRATTVSESDSVEFIDTAIEHAEKLLGTSAIDALNEIVCTGQIPRELYNENLPGSIAFDRISQAPVFDVRGKKYMADSKKVQIVYLCCIVITTCASCLGELRCSTFFSTRYASSTTKPICTACSYGRLVWLSKTCT